MRLRILEELSIEVSAPTNENSFWVTMDRITRRLNFDHFAVSLEQWLARTDEGSFLAHSYPDRWGKFYVEFGLGLCDPVRRAGEKTFSGFAWQQIGKIIPLTRRDEKMLAIGGENGIADGYTVPRFLPGQASGSCTFAVGPGSRLPVEMLAIEEVIGALALGTAKRIAGIVQPGPKPRLSDRQRECVVLVARGHTAQQIARMLKIGVGTVISHLRTARERYDVHCSEGLIVSALVDGLFSLADVHPASATYHLMPPSTGK